jgi:hypothetical protein
MSRILVVAPTRIYREILADSLLRMSSVDAVANAATVEQGVGCTYSIFPANRLDSLCGFVSAFPRSHRQLGELTVWGSHRVVKTDADLAPILYLSVPKTQIGVKWSVC